jgi:hypothetical protein
LRAAFSDTEIRKIIDDAVSRQSLSRPETEALISLAYDPDGLPRDSIASIISPVVSLSLEEAQIVAMDLVSKDLLITEDGTGPRLVVNYALLQIPTALVESLRHRKTYEELGHPTGPRSTTTLEHIFDTERGRIFLVLGVTSHRAFRRLADRADRGWETILVLPNKKHVPAGQEDHWKQIVSEWKSFLRGGKRSLRHSTRVLVATNSIPHLFTTGLTKNCVRFNVRPTSDESTRLGEMVQAQAGSTLYEMVYQQYCQIIASSVPLGRVWPFDWLKYYLKHRSLWILLAALAVPAFYFNASANPLAVGVTTFALGILAAAVWEYMRQIKWPPTELYGK